MRRAPEEHPIPSPARVLRGIAIRIHIRSLHSRQNLNPVAGVTQVLWAALLHPLRFPSLSETHRDDADDTVEVQVLDRNGVVTTPGNFRTQQASAPRP